MDYDIPMYKYGQCVNIKACRPVAGQRPRDKQIYNKSVSTAEIRYSNRGTVFSVPSGPRCFKQGSWSNELVVRQSSAGKNVTAEAEVIVGIRHQPTTGVEVAKWEDFMCAVVTVTFGVYNSVRLS
jgi:hypothetical protein